jgi:TetR/AcrR family transcriptional regulator, cholesterol catabolism regulator
LVTLKVSLVLCPIMTVVTDTGERIKQKAADLFMQYGLRSVSMDDIANGLGISKKTIYQFYADKDELVDAFITEKINYNQSCCEMDKDAAENAVHEIFLAIDMMMEIMSSMNPSLLFEMQKYHPAAFGKFYKHKNDYLFTVIRDNILRGIKEELFRPDINVDILARFRVESMMLPFQPDFHTKTKYNLFEIEEELLMHYLFGLVSEKGYQLTIYYQQERIKKLHSDETK